MSLAAEVEASYSAIIDGLLANSDLATVSAKRIRKGLQSKVDYDITPEKDAITTLILARFDKATAAAEQNGNGAASAPEPAPTAKADPPSAPATNGVSKPSKSEPQESPSPAKKRSASSGPPSPSPSNASSPLSSAAPGSPEPTPVKKKHKKTGSTVDDDAEFARKLQAEENSRSARSTRGGGATKKKPLVKRDKVVKKKKKSAKRLDGDDDSELDEGSGKEVKRTGGFHKPMLLSTPLAELLGETQLSRPQCVKKIWDYVKARDLQDPNDKRQIRCDEPMRAVFKSDRVHMFTMNKILNQNLYAVDE